MAKSLVLNFTLACGLVLQFGCASPRGSSTRVVTQASTYDALYHALYNGVVQLREMAPHGDLGLGALDGFNGEIILLDGKFYSIFGDGRVAPITDLRAKAVFFELTRFHGDVRHELPAGTSIARMQQSPLDFLPTKNIIYAVKIEGVFQHVKTRSMFKQAKPYVSLTELAKTQPTFEFNNVRGTMVGFWSPPSMKGVALAGWHLHFLTADRQGGGHVLEFTTQDAIMKADECREFHWLIPNSDDFRHTDFTTPWKQTKTAEEKIC
jgi:acetolactate decarboxylase